MPPQQFDIKKLLDAEIKELKNSAFQKPVDTLYIGGGSPACLGADALCGFLSEILKLTGKPEEFTVEINPADVDETFLKKLFALGVNRISIGVQSFDDEELIFLGRRYTAQHAQKTIETAKIVGFKNIGIDLIFAIPNSNLNNWRHTLKKAIESDVQHISAYSLTYEKNTPLQKIKAEGKLKTVGEELDRKMYETAIAALAEAGFEHYEISNFAKPGFECRHNLAYWKNDYYLGIGPAAAGFLQGRRIENINDIEKYIAQKEPVAIKISPQEKACQTAVLGLRLIKGINLTEYKQKMGFDIFELFKSSLDKNLKLNLLRLKNDCLSLTQNALPIADSILCDFAQPD